MKSLRASFQRKRQREGTNKLHGVGANEIQSGLHWQI